MTPPIKLSELEAKASKATKGNWTHNDMFESHGLFEVFSADTSTTVAQMLQTRDSRYITAANPITISRLCEAIRIAVGALNAAHQDDPWIVSEDTLTKIKELIDMN